MLFLSINAKNMNKGRGRRHENICEHMLDQNSPTRDIGITSPFSQISRIVLERFNILHYIVDENSNKYFY